MRTSRYGEIKDFKSLCSVDNFITIPVQISKKDRWICHVMQSDPKGNGNWGSAILAFVDNYGEIYFFFEHSLGQPTHLSHYIRWNIDDNGGTNDKNIYAIINQGGLKCESKQELNFPLTDDFIDILKCYSRPDSAYSNAKKDIELFVKKLIETNKKIQGSIDESFDIINTLQEKIDEIQNDEEYHLQYKSNTDKWTGRIVNESLSLYILFEEKYNSIYYDYEVWGSWNNWTSGFELQYYKSIDDKNIWLIEFNSKKELPNLGKYHYKFKKNGEWIEPTENDLREKDEYGNWNYVIFIHQ